MAWRIAYWLGGFFVIAGVAVRTGGAEAITWLVLSFTAWVAIGILVEFQLYLSSQRLARDNLRSLRPPDGRAEIANVADVMGQANRVDPRFARLVGWRSADEQWPPDRFSTRVPGTSYPQPMLGRVVLASVFLGRDERAWSEAEIAEAHRSLWRACEWIEREASNWMVPVNVALCQVYLEGSENGRRDAPDLVMGLEQYQVSLFDPRESHRVIANFRRIVEEQYQCSVELWSRQLRARVEADHLICIVHSLCAGRSHLIEERESGLSGLPVALCYAREEDGEEPWVGAPFSDPITFIHEVLHAFGATDKYGTSLGRFEMGEVTENDVMLLHTATLSRLRVDPMSAREIGWSSGREIPNAVKQRTRRGSRKEPDGFFLESRE